MKSTILILNAIGGESKIRDLTSMVSRKYTSIDVVCAKSRAKYGDRYESGKLNKDQTQ